MDSWNRTGYGLCTPVHSARRGTKFARERSSDVSIRAIMDLVGAPGNAVCLDGSRCLAQTCTVASNCPTSRARVIPAGFHKFGGCLAPPRSAYLAQLSWDSRFCSERPTSCYAHICRSSYVELSRAGFPSTLRDAHCVTSGSASPPHLGQIRFPSLIPKEYSAVLWTDKLYNIRRGPPVGALTARCVDEAQNIHTVRITTPVPELVRAARHCRAVDR